MTAGCASRAPLEHSVRISSKNGPYEVIIGTALAVVAAAPC